MVEYILVIFIVITSIVGLTEILRNIEQKIYCNRKNLKNILIIPISNHCETIECTLREKITKEKWTNEDYNNIILLDIGMTEECKQICECICNDYSGITICEYNKLDDVIMDKIYLANT